MPPMPLLVYPPVMIAITPSIALDDSELSFSFVRASGPGGQHVNTTASAVQLRFDALGSPSLPEPVKLRLRGLAGHRMTQDGVIIISADEFRSQQRNRDAAVERLVALLTEATKVRRVRRPTRPTLGSKMRRLDGKSRRSDVKAGRRKPFD